ncbi:MAG: GAF domain-containing protein [Bacillota bacterium]|nr:GAF domain-containing protein [Bacillota bacterium]
MEYQDILAKIQQDESNDLSTDLYRYNGILEAISFFTNRLTYEQIIHASFDFVNELLTVNKSVLYLLEGDQYRKVSSRNLPNAPYTVPQNPQLKNFALYVGNVVNGRQNLEAYFTADILSKTEASVMIPLMLEHSLNGFILLSGRVTADFNDNDVSVSRTLMNLFNNALESNSRLMELQTANRELDEKIFSLFAINQSAKAMLTEHRLDELNQLAVDVFSELTLSANTAFFLYDTKSEKYALKAYRDVFHAGSTTPPIYLTLRPEATAIMGRQIVNATDESDAEYFSSLFEEGIAPLEALKARYIVFIFGRGNEILGFVTLGDTISGTDYKKSTFELVDSLASYTYIALSNAMLIKVVNDQKKLLELKLDRLITLNTLIKNINSAQTSKQMIDLAHETLTVSLGVENGMIALYQPENRQLLVSAATDNSLNGTIIPLTARLEPLLKGKVIFESDATLVSEYIGHDISDALQDKAGLLAIPMSLEHYEIRLIGVIFIFRTYNSLLSEEENILTFESIANHMAPLLDGYIDLDRKKQEYIPDVMKQFTQELKAQIEECLEYHFDLEIIHLVDKDATPFNGNKICRMVSDLFQNTYAVSYDHTFVVIQNEFDYNRQVLERIAFEADASVACFKLYKDFNSYEELIELLK